jgi:histidine triad (HIT) family protein
MEYTGNDFYCDVALKGEIALEKEYESDHVLAFRHTRTRYPAHIVVIPKRHIASMLTLTKEDEPVFLEMITVIQSLAAKMVAEHGAARILTNLGEYQDSKHLHYHIIFGEQRS